MFNALNLSVYLTRISGFITTLLLVEVVVLFPLSDITPIGLLLTDFCGLQALSPLIIWARSVQKLITCVCCALGVSFISGNDVLEVVVYHDS